MSSNDSVLLSQARANNLLDRHEEEEQQQRRQESFQEQSRLVYEEQQQHKHHMSRIDSLQSEQTRPFESLDDSSLLKEQDNSLLFQESSSSPSSSLEASLDQLSEKYPAWPRRINENDDPNVIANNVHNTNNDEGGDDTKERKLKYKGDGNEPHIPRRPLSRTFAMMDRIHQNKGHGTEGSRDAYVKSGTHLKRLLDNALQKVAIGAFNDGDVELSLTVDGENDDSNLHDGQEEDHCHESGQKRHRMKNDADTDRPLRKRNKRHDHGGGDGDVPEHSDTHASQLAREKIAQVMSLKRELKEVNEHAKGMAHANSALRDSSTATAARMETLSQALRLSGEKAANARADADASEARSSSLASQLKSFKNVLDETKRTVETVRAEHDDISSASRDLEAKLLKKESELSRLLKQKAKSGQELGSISLQFKDAIEDNKLQRDQLVRRDDELIKLKKTMLELEEIENARLEMTDRLEQELRKSRSAIVELTSFAAEAESTATELQDTIHDLQKENVSLHDKIRDNADNAARGKGKLHESLAEVENEAQKLRLKAAADDEELQKVMLDKTSSEKEVQQLKTRLSNLERRLAEANAVGVISPGDIMSDATSPHSDLTSLTPSPLALSYKTPHKIVVPKSAKILAKHSQEQISIPKLKSVSSKVSTCLSTASREKINRPASSSNNSSVRRRPAQTTCSICSKVSYGIMKACQCGDPNCALRAHATCISGKNPLPSLSHPGFAAPALPAILCLRK